MTQRSHLIGLLCAPLFSSPALILLLSSPSAPATPLLPPTADFSPVPQQRIAAQEFALVDSRGVTRAWLTTSRDGDSDVFMQFNDTKGHTHIHLRVDKQGNPSINLVDSQGRPTPLGRTSVPPVALLSGRSDYVVEVNQQTIQAIWNKLDEIILRLNALSQGQ